MSIKLSDRVKHLTDIRKPIGTVVYVYEENKYIEQPNGEKVLFASPGDVIVDFNNNTNQQTGKVLNLAELEKV